MTGLAIVLQQLPVRGLSRLVRFLYYIPGALAGAASVMVWLFMLDPTVSPAAPFLRLLGYGTFGQVIEPGHLSILFAMIAFWTGAGGWIVVMYGALNNIPRDIIEAARIDGAGGWRIARRIQIPMLRKWIVYMVILAFAGGTQLFVEPQLISEASLGVAGRDYSLTQLSYDFAFQNNNVNYAAAISVELLLVCLVVAARVRDPVEVLRCELTHAALAVRRRGRPAAPAAPQGAALAKCSRSTCSPRCCCSPSCSSSSCRCCGCCWRRPRPTRSLSTAARSRSGPGMRCGRTGTRSPASRATRSCSGCATRRYRRSSHW